MSMFNRSGIPCRCSGCFGQQSGQRMDRTSMLQISQWCHCQRWFLFLCALFELFLFILCVANDQFIADGASAQKLVSDVHERHLLHWQWDVSPLVTLVPHFPKWDVLRRQCHSAVPTFEWHLLNSQLFVPHWNWPIRDRQHEQRFPPVVAWPLEKRPTCEWTLRKRHCPLLCVSIDHLRLVFLSTLAFDRPLEMASPIRHGQFVGPKASQSQSRTKNY